MEKIKIEKNRPYALTNHTGKINFFKNNTNLGNVEIGIHGLNWSYNNQSSAFIVKDQDQKDGEFFGHITIPSSNGKRLIFNESINNIKENSFDIHYKLYFPESVRINSYQVSFTFNIDWISKKTVDLFGDMNNKITIPSEYGSMVLASQKINEVIIDGENLEGFRIKLDEPTSLFIQDNRAFGSDNIEFRFTFHEAGMGNEVSAETVTERRFSLIYNQPMPLILNEDGIVDLTDTSDWFPFVLPYDDAPN